MSAFTHGYWVGEVEEGEAGFLQQKIQLAPIATSKKFDISWFEFALTYTPLSQMGYTEAEGRRIPVRNAMLWEYVALCYGPAA